MLLRLLKYNVPYVPGKKNINIADTLSQAYNACIGGDTEHSFERDMDLRMHSLVTIYQSARKG